MIEVEATAFETVLRSFNTSKNKFSDDVNTIKKWMEEQKYLPEIMDDARIRNFLLLNKCNVDKTQEKIKTYYTVRSKLWDYTGGLHLDVNRQENVTKTINFVLFPKMTKELYRVALFKLRNKNHLDDFSLLDGLKYINNVQEIRLKEDCMFGHICILDGKNSSLKLLLQVTPRLLYTALVTVYERVYSARLKALYIINAPPYIERLLVLLKKILKPKLFDRVHVHSDARILKSHFPEEMLPVDYGGTEKSLEELQEITNSKMMEYRPRFEKLNSFRMNEIFSLEDDEILGTYGKFRALEID